MKHALDLVVLLRLFIMGRLGDPLLTLLFTKPMMGAVVEVCMEFGLACRK